MTVKEAKDKIEELVDYLGELERNRKDKGKKYDTLLYIAGTCVS